MGEILAAVVKRVMVSRLPGKTTLEIDVDTVGSGIDGMLNLSSRYDDRAWLSFGLPCRHCHEAGGLCDGHVQEAAEAMMAAPVIARHEAESREARDKRLFLDSAMIEIAARLTGENQDVPLRLDSHGWGKRIAHCARELAEALWEERERSRRPQGDPGVREAVDDEYLPTHKRRVFIDRLIKRLEAHERHCRRDVDHGRSSGMFAGCVARILRGEFTLEAIEIGSEVIDEVTR